jgi:putative Mn2+ efflux pump MntP
MLMFSLIVIAVGLAMDAFAVSISSGVVIGTVRLRNALTIASFFGGFQAVMPLIGWSTGNWVRTYIAAFDHWIAFALLLLVGLRMIYESRKRGADRGTIDPTRIHVLFILAVATSIDALAVGFTLSFLDIAILVPVLVIGIVTFTMCFAGAYLGALSGRRLGSRVEMIGGLMLIGIGAKIVLEHTLR